ncbi:MAG: hypothetical protein COW79_12150, partial [Bdellovibrionales bacterium CG22_combo_CG10-13_8_21_14_all_38_13]
GYYLIRKGVKQLKKDINYRASIKEWFKNKILDFPTTFYLGGLTFLTILLIMPLVLYLKDVTNGYLWSIFIIFLTLIPASDSCLNLLNLFLTYLLSPTILPKIDLPDGIPRDAKTFVIIPTIITNCDSISRLFEDLEIRYLGNQDENLFFAILSDFSDAATKDVDSDQEMMITLKKEMQKLNLKYKNVVDKFYL